MTKPETHAGQDAVDEHDSDEHPIDWKDLARIALVALATLGSWFRLWPLALRLDVVALAVVVVGGFPIYREALQAILRRRMTMELSMTIAIGAAMAIGEVLTTLVIVLFVLVAEVLEGMTVGRGRRAIKYLVDLLPRNVLVRRDGNERELDAASIEPGDVVIVKPGARIPVDGEVIGGRSAVDQSTITGESMPVEKLPGATVFAGTINQTGLLEVRTTGVGRNTTFGKIIEAVEQAEKARAPIQKTADRLAGYLVYFALACAALTFLITRDARSTISVVIVAGACGIAAGTPLAILGAIGSAARVGSIIKGGLYLETLGRVDTVVLDKTGTVTFGEPEVVAIYAAPGISDRQVLEAAAIAEKRSEHPLARAVLAKAVAEAVPAGEPERFEYLPGMGIACGYAGEEIVVGNRAFLTQRGVDIGAAEQASHDRSEVLVARDRRLLGTLHIADVLRPQAVAAVAELRAMGLRTILLTGDAASIAASIAKELGVDESAADLLPEDKLARVKGLLAGGRIVAMIGDGINDAPALMAASVGVAVGTGTAVAMESARIVLLGSDLLKFVQTVRIARRCRRIIMQNFAGTLVVDGVGVALAAFGFLNPMFAAFIHVASELTFILNSTRLLPRGSSLAPGRVKSRAALAALPESAAKVATEH